MPRAKQNLAVLNQTGIHPQACAQGRGHVAVQKQRPHAASPMVTFLSDPEGHGRRQSPGQRPLDAVDGRHCGVEHACRAESVHRTVVLDVSLEWRFADVGGRAHGQAPPCRGHVHMPAGADRAFAFQSNGRGRRPEVPEHLPCIAQDFNALKPLGARRQGGWPVPSGHGLDAWNQNLGTVARLPHRLRFSIQGEVPCRGTRRLGQSN